ncbi:hypothetical protein DA73_0400007650 [Tolypothrix bouteillei VB521301]|uniref:Uncharacterized protein n=3 Tax=Nostocales TaxID=1161 RepID=A0A0C1R9M1_9CYAN|nr:hypothetical protein DA73_0400007650 [Tolypothrix bouteillei VB521301]
MVIGSHVATVQRVSTYCLQQNAEVFPYYGIPMNEEITLFAPHILVFCLPINEALEHHSLLQPCIFWSEQPKNEDLPSVNTPTELYTRLQEVLQL